MNFQAWVRELVHLLVGHPRRFLITMLVIMILVPSTRYWLLLQIQLLVNALVPLLLLAAIVIYAFRRMTGFTGGRRH